MSATAVSLLDSVPGANTALRLPSGDVSYAELRERVGALAASLAAGGVGAGSRVLIRVEGDPARLVCKLAVHSLGAVAAPINPATDGPELEFLVSHTEPAAAIADEELAPGLALAEVLPSLQSALGLPGVRPGQGGGAPGGCSRFSRAQPQRNSRATDAHPLSHFTHPALKCRSGLTGSPPHSRSPAFPPSVTPLSPCSRPLAGLHSHFPPQPDPG